MTPRAPAWRLALVSISVLLSAVPGIGAQVSHDHQERAATLTKLRVTTIEAQVPAVTLVRDDGRNVKFAAELDDGRAVILNFIYTTCPGICPIMSHTFSVLQDKLQGESSHVHFISISIDPEQDTPARLREYAKSFAARSGWQHYSGSVQASIAIQQAFGAYGGDKMQHDPVTFMRAAPNKPWIRIDGFASADQLLREFTRLTAEPATASR